jgi:hypothetical protein
MPAVNVPDLIDQCLRHGLRLSIHAGELVIEGDPSAVTGALIGELRTHQAGVVAALAGTVAGPVTGQPLPRALWRLELTDAGAAWRYYEAMITAGYLVRLEGRAQPEQWDVCAPAGAAASPPALPGWLARDFVTFAEAWDYWSSQAGYTRALWRDQAQSCYHVGPAQYCA